LSWRDDPLIGIGAGVVMLVAMVFVLFTMRGCLKSPPVGPELGYQCPACDHSWDQPRSLGATCPECDELGCTAAHAQCRSCKHEFKAWQTRQLGPGKFEHRLAKESAPDKQPGMWLGTPPPTLTCPKCKRPGEFTEGGQFFNPPANAGNPEAPARPSVTPEAIFE